jgi:hypothetical protein
MKKQDLRALLDRLTDVPDTADMKVRVDHALQDFTLCPFDLQTSTGRITNGQLVIVPGGSASGSQT